MENNNNFKVKLAWSFYDWANSAWSAMIITFVFSRYFVDVLASDVNIGTLYCIYEDLSTTIRVQKDNI